MNWKVTYRGRDGRMASALYEAADRATLFRTLQEAGVSAVRVEAAASGMGGSRFLAWPCACRRIARWVAALLGLTTFGLVAHSVWGPRIGAPSPAAGQGTRGTIPVAAPSRPPTPSPAAQPDAAKPKGAVTNFVNNVWHDSKGRPHYQVTRVIRPGQKTVINGRPWRPERPVFHHPSEVELDVLLSRRPGERIFGDVNWQAFMRDLPSALVDKIEFHPDDTPDVIARKKAVMEAKEELAAAMRDGEDPCEILKAARDDVNRLADVRDNLLVAVAEMRQSGASEQDIEDAVVAANKILASHGIDQPIVSPRTMRERAEAAKARKLLKQKGK